MTLALKYFNRPIMGKNKHTVTPEELTANPELTAGGIQAGDEIEIDDITNPNAGDPPPADLNPIDPIGPVGKVPVSVIEKTDLEIMETPLKLNNNQRAAAIFDAMPHIYAIWFDAEGGWRFYKTPAATIEINRPTQRTTINTNDL
jgi:hypothetical protein